MTDSAPKSDDVMFKSVFLSTFVDLMLINRYETCFGSITDSTVEQGKLVTSTASPIFSLIVGGRPHIHRNHMNQSMLYTYQNNFIDTLTSYVLFKIRFNRKK